MLRPALIAFSVTVLLPAVANAATGDAIASYPSSFPSPDGLMWDGANLWATDCSFTRIDKVDRASGQVVGSIDIAGVSSDELAWDGTSMWVSDHTATEMPNMGAPPPRIYKVDPSAQKVISYFDAPGKAKYPMGLGWDGEAVWNVDTWDKVIYRLDPSTGSVLRSIPSPANGSCGMTWDGACLWLSDASTDGLVYHLDPATGEVIRSFDGPGGPGHQSTGVAWDGEHLWVHDEAVGRAKIYEVEIDDITEGGRCAGALQVGKDAGDFGGDAPPTARSSAANESSGCSAGARRVSALGALALAFLVGVVVARRRPRNAREWT